MRIRNHYPSLRRNPWAQLDPRRFLHQSRVWVGRVFTSSVFPPVPVIFRQRIPTVTNYNVRLESLQLLQKPPYSSRVLPFPQPGEQKGDLLL